MIEIMRAPLILIGTGMDQEEVAQTFQKYHMASAPVVDEAGRIKGMVTVDDIVDIITEESEEDLLKLAGVSEAAQTDSVFKSVRARAPWLLVNLGTAVIASWVISNFEGSINQLIALAVLMPIVASMGGNAGTQTLAVAVRAIASRDLTESNAPRYVVREAMTAMSNGVIFAIVLAAVVYIWFPQKPLLSLAIALAILINFACAGLAGILVPLTLRRCRRRSRRLIFRVRHVRDRHCGLHGVPWPGDGDLTQLKAAALAASAKRNALRPTRTSLHSRPPLGACVKHHRSVDALRQWLMPVHLPARALAPHLPERGKPRVSPTPKRDAGARFTKAKPMTNAISANGLALIQELEGFQAEPKQLPTGGWVVGYSHVRATEPGDAVNENDAVELLTSDLAPFENLVNTLVTQPLTQTQFDALVSFAFSVGAEAFGRSQVLRRVNAGDYVSAACAMDAWRKSDVSGELVIIDALVRRRTAEKALFLKELPQVAAPSVFVRPQLDHAASILGAPVSLCRRRRKSARLRRRKPSRNRPSA